MGKGLALITAVLLGGVGVAPAAATDQHPARVLLENLAQDIIKTMRQERDQIEKDPTLLMQIIEEKMIPHFSIRILSRFALGRHWRQSSEAQRARFMREFQRLMVRTYGKTLFEHADKEIRFGPVHAKPDAKQVEVKSDVLLAANQELPIRYRLRRAGGQWKVFDVSVNGISLANTYRGSFDAQIREKGLDALLDDLQERNQKDFKTPTP